MPATRETAPRETLDFDVVVVGAGPAGLAAAYRLGRLAADDGRELAVCVIEKGAAVGSHIISGAILDPRALNEFLPDWAEQGAPIGVEAANDEVRWLLGPKRSARVPEAFVPVPMRNGGCYVASLGKLCRWLGEQAEAQGCTILPGFAATEVLYDDRGRVAGVVTGDRGRARDGSPKPNFEPGYELRAKYVIFAEGCRGNLGLALEARFDLRHGRDPQHYGLGLKEIWEVPAERHRLGTVMHTLGWPLDGRTDGGGFLYHAGEGQVYAGFVVALSYRNPHLDPFAELQRWKRHPAVADVLAGGRRIAYGARAVNKGGYSSLPKLVVPGGLLVGCEAGFLNPARIKGTHTAMKTGMLAAEAVFAALASGDGGGGELSSYADAVARSWVAEELYAARNFSAGLARFGRLGGAALAFVEHNLLGGRSPLTLRHPEPDYATLVPAERAAPIRYPAPDGRLSFDRPSSVYLSGTAHEEDQPCHLVLADPAVPIERNLPLYDEPAQRYCPAGVYEVVRGADGEPRFQINAANCVHCKACDIKDPAQNITWTPPEGGGGPNYPAM
ncbi:MAG TPA: electron transfer flavoprotein-ubiquinone oxidoreductase [Gammaproteobacteria bacterium]|nr:electron transfer flavoprotein-ubiquinone oxidoreductase [Gammaproteobacteria bacterium]